MLQVPGHFNFSLVLALALALPVAQAADDKQSKLSVNPLTGTPTEMDQKQRQFEALKLETAILEEQNKQAGLRGQRAGTATPSEEKKPPPPRPKPRPPEARPVPTPAPIPAGPRLVGIMWLGNQRLAIINTGAGEVVQATEGQTVAGRKVEHLTDHSARFGGQLIEVDAHPGVASNRDKQPVGIQSSSAGSANPSATSMSLTGSQTSLVLPQGTPGNFKPSLP